MLFLALKKVWMVKFTPPNMTAKFINFQCKYAKILKSKFLISLQGLHIRQHKQYTNDSFKGIALNYKSWSKLNEEIFSKNWVKEHEDFSCLTSFPSSHWKLQNSLCY